MLFPARSESGAEDDAFFRQLFLYRVVATENAVKDGVYRYIGQSLLLRKRNAQLLEGVQQFRIDLIQTAQLFALSSWEPE